MTGTPKDRFDFALATTSIFLDGMCYKYEHQVINEDDARAFTKLALRRALAMIDGDTEEARKIHDEGVALQEQVQPRVNDAVNARQLKATNTLHS